MWGFVIGSVYRLITNSLQIFNIHGFFVCVISRGEECSRITYNNFTYSLYLPVYLHAFFTLQLTYFVQLISREGEITTKQWELVCKYMSTFLWLSIKFLIKISFNYLHVFFSDTIKFYLLFFRYNQILPPDNGQNCSTNPDDNVILQQRIDSENYWRQKVLLFYERRISIVLTGSRKIPFPVLWVPFLYDLFTVWK